VNKRLGVLVLSLAGVAAAASAAAHGLPGDGPRFGGPPHDFGAPAPRGGNGMSAPEIDPSSALSALTLLGGGLMVLRGRVKKK
jgi:hypothetical protein